MKKTATGLLILLSMTVNGPSRAAPDALCGFLANPPDFPESTMLHVFFWDGIDQALYPLATTETVVVPPFGVTVTPNPRSDSYRADKQPNMQFDHGVVPTPLPSGIWIIEGNNSMRNILCFFGSCGEPIEHPDNNFKCISSDLVP